MAAKPLTGPVEVNFAIYREQADAAPLWQETQTLALDEQGRYTVLLGAMQGEGLPMELFATGEARWLAVQATGAEAQPRVLLASVPYALKAGDAETLVGKPVSDFVLAQQLKEQVQTEVAQQAKKQQDRGQQALAMVLGQGPTPMVTSQGQTSFTCPSGTSGDCVTVTQSSTGRALYAVGNSSAEALRVNQNGTGYGLLVTAGLSPAVYGVSTATTGTAFAIRGESASTGARGILGLATATTGGTIGLWGNAASTSGTGLLGDATATTGYTYGLRGRSYSSSGTGILAYTVATTGTTKGLWAEVYSADGTAAVFQNTASGKLLSGLVGTGTEVFSVAGNGNLLSAGTLTGTQLISSVASGSPPLVVASNTVVPNLNADLLDGQHVSQFEAYTDTCVAAEATERAAADTTLQSNLDAASAAQQAADALRAQLHASNIYQSSPTGTLIPQVLGPVDNSGGTGGFNSNPLDFAASAALNDGVNPAFAQSQTFRWQAEPLGDNTATPSGTLNLLFASGTTPAETGLKINADGTINFAAAQTFPAGAAGLGTITGVTAGTGLTGGGTSGTVTLDVNNTVVAFQSDLTTEANARQAADTTLQNNVNSEASARAAGDTAAISTAETASNAYTDTAVGVEAGLRAAADTAAVATSEAYTDTAVGAQTAALNTHKTSGDHDARYAQLAHTNTFQLLGTAIPQVLGPVDNSTGAGGFASNPVDLVASAALNDGINPVVAQNQTFRWQAEPAGDNTATPAATLNLLYGQNTTPAETGLKINADGTITFAGGQTFPGTGAVTSVGSGTGLTGGPITTSGTLSVDNSVVAFQTDLTTEASARQAADTTLQSNLAAESTARSAADGTLQADISTRVSKAGDSMSGTLNLPANGLMAGTNQLVLSGGNVGVGTSSPSNILTVEQGGGNVLADGYSVYSSRRFKTHIEPLRSALQKVQSLQGVSYDVKSNGQHEIGLIAEDVGKVVPEVVSYEKNGVDAQGLDYSRLTALLIEATKEQQRQIDRLSRSNREKAQQIQALAQQVRELRNVQQEVARVEARLARLEKPQPAVNKAKKTTPATAAAKRTVVAKLQF